MRITKLWIKEYKNLKDFTWELNSDSPVSVIIGKNASGKTNLLEAIIYIFTFLYSYGSKNNFKIFDFQITYFLDGEFVTIECENQKVTLDEGNIYDLDLALPEYIFVYYGGLSERFDLLMKPVNQQYSKFLRTEDEYERKLINLPTIHYKFVLLSWLMGTIDKVFLQKQFNINPTEFVAQIRIGKPRWAKSDDISINWGIPLPLQTTLSQFLVRFDNEIVTNQAGNREILITLKPFKSSEDLAEFGYELGLFNYFCDLHFSELLKNIMFYLKKQDADKLIPFEFLSEGEIQRIGIRGIFEIFRGEEILFLLDEPDTFAHPRWQWEFVPDIQEALIMRDENGNIEEIQDNAQAIFVTHSPIILSSLNEPAYLMENGKIKKMNSTFGYSINETLAEQGVDYRKDEITDKLKLYFVMIQEGEAQSDKAKELRNYLENSLGKKHKMLEEADDLISLYE